VLFERASMIASVAISGLTWRASRYGENYLATEISRATVAEMRQHSHFGRVEDGRGSLGHAATTDKNCICNNGLAKMR
jgi:hypothetical protein